MSSSEHVEIPNENLVPKFAWCTPTHIEVRLESGLLLQAPLGWYAFLTPLTHAERNQITCTGMGLLFDAADEFVSVEGLLLGWKQKASKALLDAAE